MKIGIVGIGYVGLSNAILLALNNEVVAYDIDFKKVDLLNNKKSPINDSLAQEYLDTKELNLKATIDYKVAYENAEFVLICTPTDYDENLKYFDTSSVESTVKEIIEINPQANIVIKSTIPIGFTEKMKKKYNSNKIIFSPEFTREGKALHDNLYQTRIIVGDTTEIGKKFSKLLIKEMINKEIPILFTNSTEAEAIKLFSNTYLALRVAFFNELDSFAEIKGLKTEDIIKGISMDYRIGDYYNNPSFGYGGYCLPKDSKQLLADYKNVPQSIFSAIIESNKKRKEHIVDMILSKKPKTVGVYRLIMKSDSDNFRQSAIHDVIIGLKKDGIDIVVYEPLIVENYIDNSRVIKNIEEFFQMSDIIIANRYSSELNPVKNKLYTRDVFNEN